MSVLVYVNVYDPTSHKYQDGEEIAMREVTPGHFVFCSEEEYKKYKEIYQ